MTRRRCGPSAPASAVPAAAVFGGIDVLSTHSVLAPMPPVPMPRPLFGLAFALAAAPAAAQHDHGGHGEHAAGHAGGEVRRAMSEVPVPKRDLSPPRVFLDKSPRIVAYQLDRLDDARLLMVERSADDPKFAPVYAAILARPGVSNKDRAAALDALVELNDSDPVAELLSALEPLTSDEAGDRRAAEKLTDLLLARSADELKASFGELTDATTAGNRPARVAAFAALIESGKFSVLNMGAGARRTG